MAAVTPAAALPGPPDRQAGSAAPGALRVDMLQAFVVLADELHFTRAAERLFLSQSGLSRRIALLELTLGIGLVARTTREVSLTPAGQAFAMHAGLILAATEEAVEALHRSRASQRSDASDVAAVLAADLEERLADLPE